MNNPKKKFSAFICAFLACVLANAQTINVIYTTDVHGAIFNYDFVRDTVADHSLANAYGYIESVRDTSSNVILLDAGDMLQGTPVVYYYNYIDSASTHVIPRVYNFMKYDAVCVGNHDIEAGHAVYDKVVRQMQAPMLGANVMDTKTGKPYFQPYAIFERAGKKIAVIGITTPYVPHWLTEFYWSGMEFRDMIESAKFWVKKVRDEHKPDVVIGLFHSGYDYTYGGQSAKTYCNENASVLVAEQVEGFDALLIGHDHKLHNKKIKSPSGKLVPVIDAGVGARNLGLLSITFDKDGRPSCNTSLIALSNVKPSESFNKAFLPHMLAVKAYTKKVVCDLASDVNAYESLLGSSAFVDVIHRTMLKHTGADISMSAPLLINANLKAGPLTVGRMFSLYRYENTLTVVRMTGAEVKKYLEYSYDLWIRNPEQGGHVLNVTKPGRLAKSYYNLDSAAGIIYAVNVTKPFGERVNIISMANGAKFNPKKEYKVALNSYRANGGGGHLEQGVGIPFDKIKSRIVKTIPQDLRGIVMQDLSEQSANGAVEFKPLNNWEFTPVKVADKYLMEDIKPFMSYK